LPVPDIPVTRTFLTTLEYRFPCKAT